MAKVIRSANGDASLLAVCRQVTQWLEFQELGIAEDIDVIFAAISDNLDGSPAEFRGLVTASRHSNGRWYLNDLATLGGCGRQLLEAVIAYAIRNQKSVTASFNLHLLSLDVKSTSFWTHMGFTATGDASVSPLPMARAIAIASDQALLSVSSSSGSGASGAPKGKYE